MPITVSDIPHASLSGMPTAWKRSAISREQGAPEIPAQPACSSPVASRSGASSGSSTHGSPLRTRSTAASSAARVASSRTCSSIATSIFS